MNNKHLSITKKNIVRNIFLIIVFYISLLIFHNASSIFKNIFLSTNDKLILLNKTMLLSIIIISFIMIFKNILFRKKIYLWVIILFLLGCNSAEGFFLDFKAYTFIIIYIYLLLMTFYFIIKTKNNFELSMVYSFSILILSAFVVGLFGLLFLFKYVMLLFGIYMIWYIHRMINMSKIDIENALEKLFSPGFIIFNILWLLAIFFGAGLYVHSYDEYSHWAYDAKAMIYYAKFGNSQEIMLQSRTYAPIFTVWHYIVSIFGGFSEHNLYIGLNILVSIYLLPAFVYLKNNSMLIKIFATVALIFGCYLFGGVYSYFTLYVDYAMTVIFASSVIVYFISKDKKTNMNRILLLLFIILTLGKPNGFIIAFVTLVIIGINELIDSNIESIKTFFKVFWNIIIKYKKYILAIIITFIVWRVYVFLMNAITNDYYDFSLLSQGLKADLQYKFNYSFFRSFFGGIIKSFDDNCIGGLMPLTLYQFIIISIAILYLLFYKLIGDSKKALYKVMPFIISYAAFFILTIISMFVAMNIYEAGRLASFGRYLNWYNVAIIIFEIVLVLRIDSKKHLIFKVLFLAYIVISISFSSLISFAINPIKSESYNVSVERNKKAEIINDYTPDDSLIYIIDQKDTDGIMAMWYTRYYVFPRKTNASAAAINWKIKTRKNQADLADWGFTAEKWSEHLKNYKFDYVYLYSADDLFFENTSFMYYDYNEAKKYSLFKIEYVNNNIKLIPIK